MKLPFVSSAVYSIYAYDLESAVPVKLSEPFVPQTSAFTLPILCEEYTVFVPFAEAVISVDLDESVHAFTLSVPDCHLTLNCGYSASGAVAPLPELNVKSSAVHAELSEYAVHFLYEKPASTSYKSVPDRLQKAW